MDRPAIRLLSWLAALGILGVIALGSTGCSRQPKPVSNWTIPEAKQFQEFPLYWLGETYAGLPLTSMRLTTDGNGVTHATFNYGDPSRTGQGSWLPPLKIDIQPYCGYSPFEFLSHDEYWHEDWNAEPIEVHVRGVNGYLQRYSSTNSSLFLWSGGSSIHVGTWKSNLEVEEAAKSLTPIADENASATQPLPPSTPTSC